MTASHIVGPDIIYGRLTNLLGTGGSGSGGANPEAGPSGTYQGDCILDPRFTYQPGVTGVGKIYGYFDGPYVQHVNVTPSAYGAAKIAAAQTATSGTAMTLVSTAAAGITPGAPMVPNYCTGAMMTAANVVNALALDFGFATCTTNGTTTISAISNTSILAPGITVIVGTTPATVVSISGTTAVLDTVISGSATGIALAFANGPGQNAPGPAPRPPVAFWPFMGAGIMAVFDANSGLARGVSVTSNNAGDTGWTVTVAGYDIYGVPMHETISVAANSVAYGNKAWKFITSVTPTKSGTSSGTFSIGTSDVFGFALRDPLWETANVFWNGAYLTASTGWTGAVATTATATTGDVRGTMQVSPIGPNSGASSTSSTGTVRLAIYTTIQATDLFSATPVNPVPLFGVTQF